MKKVILAVAVIAMVGFASCKKSSNCVCTYKIDVAGVETTVTTDPAEYEVKSCDKIETIEGVEGIKEITCEAAK